MVDPRTNTGRSAQAVELTSLMLHKYYCENDVETLIDLMDDHILWLGTGEQEFAWGKENVSGIFRTFAGQVPKCNISGEEYQSLQLTPETCLCSGRLWIATDASTQISLRVHQRITTVFRWVDGKARCCHIHISNPYEEMAEEDTGFPTKMAKQSYLYLQEQIAAKKKEIGDQTERLRQMSYVDSLTGLYNRNKFNQMMESQWEDNGVGLGVACFDLNGLKQVNDNSGHISGDNLIRNTAAQIQRFFEGKAYRIGGDEFVVIDTDSSEQEFQDAVQAVQKGMEQAHISCAAGSSWRRSNCNALEQYEEADRRMYEHKRCYYKQHTDSNT